MIEDTLRKLEERIRASESAGDGARGDLLALVAELRSEFAEVAESHGEDAAAIAAHTERIAGDDKGPATGAVADSMLEFESAHPRITGLLQSLMRTLADAGI